MIKSTGREGGWSRGDNEGTGPSRMEALWVEEATRRVPHSHRGGRSRGHCGRGSGCHLPRENAGRSRTQTRYSRILSYTVRLILPTLGIGLYTDLVSTGSSVSNIVILLGEYRLIKPRQLY